MLSKGVWSDNKKKNEKSNNPFHDGFFGLEGYIQLESVSPAIHAYI